MPRELNPAQLSLSFVVFLRKRDLSRIVPFCGAAAIASVMSFDVFSPISKAVIGVLPPLGYSRFPSGDYRTLIALSILVSVCGGLAALLSRKGITRALAARYILGLLGITTLLLIPLLRIEDRITSDNAFAVLVLQLGPALLLGGFLFAARRPAAWRRLPIVAAVLCVLSASPILVDMGGWWRVPAAEQAASSLSGVYPGSERQWSPNTVFQTRLAARPGRTYGHDPDVIAWRGYLAGEFMADDYGGAVLTARRNVDRDDDVRSFMQEASTLVAIPCGGEACESTVSDYVAFGGDAQLPESRFTWQVVSYTRSLIRYHLTLSENALVVENELFSSGWRGSVDGLQTVLPVEVDGGPRGWILPAGDHDFSVRFETPLLGLGLVVSAVAAAAYVAALAAVLSVYCRAQPRRLGREYARRGHCESVD